VTRHDLADRAHKRRASCDHLVEHASKRVDVGRWTDRSTTDLLWRHIGRRAGDRPIGRHAAQTRWLVRFDDERETEVDDLRRWPGLARRQDHVLGLDVTVDETDAVRCTERHRDLASDADRLAKWQRSTLEAFAERLAAQELHDEVERVVVGTEVEHGDG